MFLPAHKTKQAKWPKSNFECSAIYLDKTITAVLQKMVSGFVKKLKWCFDSMENHLHDDIFYNTFMAELGRETDLLEPVQCPRNSILLFAQCNKWITKQNIMWWPVFCYTQRVRVNCDIFSIYYTGNLINIVLTASKLWTTESRNLKQSIRAVYKLVCHSPTIKKIYKKKYQT